MPANSSQTPHLTRKRFMDVWHRRAGKDLTALALIAREMATRIGYYIHVFPTLKQGKAIIWDGKDNAGIPFMDRFPQQLILEKNETECQVVLKPLPGQPGYGNPKAKGSIYQIRGADDPNSLRGGNPIGVLHSEYQQMDPMTWEIVRPIIEANGGWAGFLLTPEGQNHAFQLYKTALANPDTWFCQLLTIDDTKQNAPGESGEPIVTQAQIEQMRKEGVPEEIIQQEYFCSFTGFLRGTIFGDLLTKARAEHRIGRVPWNSNLPVGTIWDIGRYDHTAIWFYQRLGESICFIDYYEDRLKGADFYAKLVREKPYLTSKHILPFDAKSKSFTAEYSTEEFLARTMRGVTVAPKLPVQTQIDITRRMFSRFAFDEVNCGVGLSHLENFRRKYSEDLKSYSGDPIHDEHSHGSHSLMTGAVGGMSQPLEFHDEGYNMAPPMRECDFDVFAGRIN